MSSGTVAAVDLGASSGRVMVGHVGPDRLDLEEVHRFPNDPVALPDGLHWDVLRLFHEVVVGLGRAGRAAPGLSGIGIDSWGVDYGLLDETGTLLSDPYHYRDGRTAAGVEAVHRLVDPAALYACNGLQFLPFNTIYQLAAARSTPVLSAARTLLLIPDLIGYWLTGVTAAERTNASTTGLLDVSTGAWAEDLATTIGVPPSLLPALREPGEEVSRLLPSVAEESGLAPMVHVTHVGSHDTASAVVGVPAEGDEFAFVVSGTWSLVGVELDAPILSEESRAANFTNEGGVDGRIRYLRNVMGLWLLQESMRTWEHAGSREDLGTLLGAAAALPPGGPVIDPDDAMFLPPGDMPRRIEDACRRAAQPLPETRPALVRCILDSLALAYARALGDAMRLSGQTVKTVHLVGGGTRNELLCQLTADACQLPVVAGPVEATALGNVLVQARANGFIRGDLEALRARIRATQPLRSYQPRAMRIATVA